MTAYNISMSMCQDIAQPGFAPQEFKQCDAIILQAYGNNLTA